MSKLTETPRRKIQKCTKHSCRLEIDGLATFLQRQKVYFCRKCEWESWGFDSEPTSHDITLMIRGR